MPPDKRAYWNTIFITLFLTETYVVGTQKNRDGSFEHPKHMFKFEGVQWLSGRVLDSWQRGCRFEPHRCHCLVVLEQDTFILA